MEIDLPTIIFENSGGESDLSSADKDDIIDAIYGHGELTMTVCTLCVCVCLCVHMCCVCVCDDGTRVTVCLNVRVIGDGVADLISLNNLLGGCRGNQVGVVIVPL